MSYFHQKDFLKYVQKKRGVSQAITKQILKDFTEFVIYSLLEQHKVHLQELGSLQAVPSNRYGLRIKFRPAQKLKNLIRGIDSLGKSYNPILKFLHQEEGSSDFEPSISPTPEELGRIKENGENIVRKSFLTYLREQLPYGKDWQHPITKELFSHQLVRERLEFFRKNYPENFSILWGLWTNQKSRRTLSKHHCFSANTVQRRWDASIDNILTLLLFPDLEPSIPFELDENHL